MYVTLQSSTRFEHQHAHLQEDKLYYHSIWYRHSHVNVCTVYQMTADVSLLSSGILYSRLHESDDTRCCDNTICPPEDGHVDARNMSRIVM